MGFILRPNSRFSTNLNQAIGDTTTTLWNVNSVPVMKPCVLIVDPGSGTQEKIKVTGTGAGTLTVIRNYDGKGAFPHGFNATIVDYDSPEYIYDMADLLEANFNADNTPNSSIFTRQDFATGFANFIVSGLLIPTSGTLSTTCTLGVAYYNGTRYSIPSDGGHTYIASQDTYVDVNPTTGAYTYNNVANGAGAPALTASTIRIAKIVSSGSAITTSTQTGVDSLGNSIHPTSPIPTLANPNVAGANATGLSQAITSVDATDTDITGAAVTLTTTGNRCLVIATITASLSVITDYWIIYLHLDGATQVHYAIGVTPVTGKNSTISIVFGSVPSAGSHTWKLAGAVAAGGQTLTIKTYSIEVSEEK